MARAHNPEIAQSLDDAARRGWLEKRDVLNARAFAERPLPAWITR
jgi:hypothetical protein